VEIHSRVSASARRQIAHFGVQKAFGMVICIVCMLEGVEKKMAHSRKENNVEVKVCASKLILNHLSVSYI
jgi:hypothetical protein